MPWQTKTLDQQVTDVQRGFNANLPGADAALVRNNLKPTSKVIAGGLYELSRFGAWAADQRFILTCDDDQLDRHGAEMKPPVPRKEAAAAHGAVDVTASEAITLASGAILARSDGVQFRVIAGIVLIGAGSSTIQVEAVSPGADGASDADTALTAVSGLTGAATFAVSAAGLGGGADAEQDGAYRARLLFAKAFPDHAGAPPDWLRYALAISGVTRAFIEPLGHGRGTVVIYPFFDLTRANGIPLETDRQIVQAALLLAAAGAALPVVRIAQAVTVDVQIAGLSPATPEVEQAVAAEIANAFFSFSRVAGSAEPHPSMSFLATPETFSRSWLWQAVANASGEQRHSLVLPAADVALSPGQTAVLGTLSFVP